MNNRINKGAKKLYLSPRSKCIPLPLENVMLAGSITIKHVSGTITNSSNIFSKHHDNAYSNFDFSVDGSDGEIKE